MSQWRDASCTDMLQCPLQAAERARSQLLALPEESRLQDTGSGSDALPGFQPSMLRGNTVPVSALLDALRDAKEQEAQERQKAGHQLHIFCPPQGLRTCNVVYLMVSF